MKHRTSSTQLLRRFDEKKREEEEENTPTHQRHLGLVKTTLLSRLFKNGDLNLRQHDVLLERLTDLAETISSYPSIYLSPSLTLFVSINLVYSYLSCVSSCCHSNSFSWTNHSFVFRYRRTVITMSPSATVPSSAKPATGSAAATRPTPTAAGSPGPTPADWTVLWWTGGRGKAASTHTASSLSGLWFARRTHWARWPRKRKRERWPRRNIAGGMWTK